MISFVTDGPAQATTRAQLERLRVTGDATVSARRSAGVTDVLDQLHDLLMLADQAVVLISGYVVVHDEAVRELVCDPRDRTVAAVSARSGGIDVRRRGGLVVSAGSALHSVSEADAAFTGLLVISRADLLAARRAVEAMSDALSPRSGGDVVVSSGASGDAVSYVLVALVRSGIAVAAVDIDPWPWTRAASSQDVPDFLEGASRVDAPAVRLVRAMRADDGFYSTFVVRRLSRRLTVLALRLRLRPNQITVASLILGMVAAAAFATGGRPGLVIGALLLQVSLVVDCVDGEVARYTRAFTPVGAWLDASTDRIKEYACYAGLAYGAGAAGAVDPWLLAAAMLSLQTARHTMDYTFTLVKNVREGSATLVPLGQRTDITGDGIDESAAVRALRASARSNERPLVRWTKKAMYLPIGERWFVISVTAALGSAYVVFATLLSLACVALVYTTAARLLRSRTWTTGSTAERERQVVRAQLDRGPLGSALARVLPWQLPVGRLAWTVPAVLRVVEFAGVLLVVTQVAPQAMPAAFALIFVVAYHHYDALYRVLNGLPSAGAVRAAALGVEGRLLVVGALAWAGADTLPRGLVVLTIALAVLVLGVGTTGGVRALRQRQGDDAPAEALNV